MGYNILDLIDKGIDIAIKRKHLYRNIENKNINNPSLKIMSKVLIKQVDDTINYYRTLKGKPNIQFDEIDFSIYDKMSFLINEFNKKMYQTEVNNTKELLILSLQLEKDAYSLLVDIQGRYVRSISDTHTETYKILSDVIKNKSKHIEALEKTLRQ